MKLSFLYVVALMICFPGTSPRVYATPPVTWKVNKYEVTFKIKNAGLTVDGSFTGLTADIKFDSRDITSCFIEAGIDVNTINTGITMRNNHLKEEEYFNATKYPRIILQSVSFTKENDGTFKGLFKLTMKGITKTVSIPFSYTETGNEATFKGSFSINRRDYNVGGSSWTMSDNATVTIIVNAIKQ